MTTQAASNDGFNSQAPGEASGRHRAQEFDVVMVFNDLQDVEDGNIELLTVPHDDVGGGVNWDSYEVTRLVRDQAIDSGKIFVQFNVDTMTGACSLVSTLNFRRGQALLTPEQIEKLAGLAKRSVKNLEE